MNLVQKSGLIEEVRIQDLKNNYDEFKDLSYDQLMKIAEVCVKAYNEGLDFDTEEQQSEIEDLENEIEELNDRIEQLESDNATLSDENYDLVQKVNELQEELSEKDL